MAGGQGTRFWPWSTDELPKQFLNIIGTEPLITQTFNRLKHFLPVENIFVVADRKYQELVIDFLPGFKHKNYIYEPLPRNTAPCLILANIVLSRLDPDANLLVVPADHYIPDINLFGYQMQTALDYADNNCIITCGIKPSSPHTGYGYIRFDAETNERKGNTEFFTVQEFKEKPDIEHAREYINQGNYYWNSGMFIYKLSHFKEFLGEYSPYYFIQYNELEKVIHHRLAFEEMFSSIKPESIDYALMENLKEVTMFKAGFLWSDVGAWSSVYELNEKDKQQNVSLKPNNIFIDAERSLIFSTEKKPVAVIGLENVTVINTENGILVADIHELQKVKQVIAKLKEIEETSSL